MDYILLTHHHHDHIAGGAALRGTNVKVIGATADKHRLPALDQKVQSDDSFQFGAHTVKVLEASGHAVGHIAYYFPAVDELFCGDAIFAMGCGKLFESTAQQAWDTFCRFAELPDATQVYFGHGITSGNADFCEKIDPNHAPTAARIAEVRKQRAAGERTIPTTIGAEKETNIFMRAGEPQVAAAVGLAGADAVSVFTELRRCKDQGSSTRCRMLVTDTRVNNSTTVAEDRALMHWARPGYRGSRAFQERCVDTKSTNRYTNDEYRWNS